MLLLLYGPNDYAREQKARDIIDTKKKQYPDAPYKVFNGDDGACKDLEAFVFESGLFANGKKIAIVRNPSVYSTEDEVLWKRICNRAQNDDVLLLLLQQTTTRSLSKELSFTGGVSCKSQFFGNYTETDAINILLDEGKEINCFIDRVVGSRIYSYAGGDVFGAVQELHRLSLLRVPITIQLLKTLPEYAESMTVYDFARAISQPYKNNTTLDVLKKKLTLWEYMRAQKTDFYMVFGYLAKMAHSTTLINALARADEMVKSGRLEIDQALEEIVVS